jgi:effector-binding domain-containing protein
MKTLFCCFVIILAARVAIAADELKVDIQELKEQSTLVVKGEKIKPAEIGPWLAKVFPKIGARMKALGLKQESALFTKYNKMNDDSFDLEAGVAVPAGTKGEGDVIEGKLPGGKTAVVTHVGPYAKLGETWAKLRQWLTDNKKEMGDGAWESYVDDPGNVKEAELKTVIYISVK